MSRFDDFRLSFFSSNIIKARLNNFRYPIFSSNICLIPGQNISTKLNESSHIQRLIRHKLWNKQKLNKTKIWEENHREIVENEEEKGRKVNSFFRPFFHEEIKKKKLRTEIKIFYKTKNLEKAQQLSWTGFLFLILFPEFVSFSTNISLLWKLLLKWKNITLFLSN